MRPPKVTILSTADYDSPVWTNKQHLALRLARAGLDVVFVNSLGLREPTLGREDLRRVARALKRGKAASTPTEVLVLQPRVLPLHRSKAIRYINQILIQHTLARKLVDRDILWTFSPLTYGLEATHKAVVYHSVDFLDALPRVPSTVLREAEIALTKRAQATVSSSRPIYDRLMALGSSRPHLWENVADTDLFRRKSRWNGGAVRSSRETSLPPNLT